MLSALVFLDFSPDMGWMFQPDNLFNLLFLGVGTLTLRFVSRNFAMEKMGIICSSVYIYLELVVTVITSVLFLSDPLAPLAAIGMALILCGLAVSEIKFRKTKNSERLDFFF